MLMGAHAPPLVRPTTNIIIVCLLFLLISFSSSSSSAQPIDSSQILLNFKTSLSNAAALANWAPSTNPCSPAGRWTGVLCSDENHIWGLQLEKMNLSGEIDVASLVSLPLLRSLSFMNNEFEGPMPDVRKLGALKSLFLSNNRFSGEIPDDAFTGMASLKKVYIANNNFTGNIPTSLAKSPRLLELRLENNHFVGLIPDFPPDLKLLNVSNNRLQGPIPKNLIAMDTTSFSGNAELCGKPLDSVCKPSTPPPAAAEKPPSPLDPATTSPPTTDTSDNNNSSSLRTALIVIATLVALAAMVVLFMVFRRRSRDSQTPQLGRTLSSSYNTNHNNNDDDGEVVLEPNNAVGLGAASMSGAGTAHSRSSKGSCDQQQHGRLTFVREERQRFELQDLLRASAEVLGSGSFGSSYKAVLLDGQAVVVKRFKQMNTVGKEEFHEHMRRLGRLRHPNLLPLVAYYYRKEEKLLVFDFVHNGSLATQLHGNQSVEQAGLDWPTRLKIIKGVTQGLAYLHTELPSVTLPHGHLKSSNVLLDKSFHPVMMDYTLVPVVNPDQAHQFIVAYKSPEFALHGRATKKTDAWTLGILILEILTGKSPAAHGSDYGSDLASWVTTMNGEESTQVFDRGMGSTENGKGEMMKLLKIGVACCHEDLERRLDVKEAVEKIELLKERDDLII